LKYIKTFESYVKEGVKKVGDTFEFDWLADMPDDVMPLRFKKYRGKTLKFGDSETTYTYYYAYEMVKSDFSTDFMKSLKTLDDNIKPRDVSQLVNKAVIGFDNVFGTNKFDTIVSPVSSSLILTEIVNQLQKKSGVTNLFSEAFVKNTSTDITLDMDKVNNLPEKTYKSVMKSFEKATAPGKPFKIKEIFSAYRKFFHDFIKFNKSEDKKLFNAVEGKRIILVDDYKTSGTTIKEMMKQLSDCGATEVVIFVLIKLG
jgi:hypothetical protein